MLSYSVLVPLNSTVIIEKTGVPKAMSEARETKSLHLDATVIRLQGWKSRRPERQFQCVLLLRQS